MGKFTGILFIWVILSSAFVLFQENQTPKNDVYGVVLEKSIECSNRDCRLSVSPTGKVLDSNNAQHRIQVKKDSGEIVEGVTATTKYDRYEVNKSYNFGVLKYNVITGFTQGDITTPESDLWMWLRIINALLLCVRFIPWIFILIAEIDL